jgi:hypothetical protein
VSNRIYCYDTEFLEDGRTIELISIGIVCDDGSEYYAVNADMPVTRITEHAWLKKNVWPQLPIKVKPKWVIANEVRDFITGCIEMGDSPKLWADYCAYDHVVLAQLYGPMINLPEGIPMFTHDIEQLKERLPGTWKAPKQASGVHNALEDARHNMRVYRSAMAFLAEES